MYAETVGKNSSSTTADYAPYIQQLNDALTTASASLSTIKSTRAVVERQSETEIASLVAGIVSVSVLRQYHPFADVDTPVCFLGNRGDPRRNRGHVGYLEPPPRS
jgi:hypothetical protein